MEKQVSTERNTKLNIVLGVVLVLVLLASYGFFKMPVSKTPSSAKPVSISSILKKDTLTYTGESGKDALTLLKSHGVIEQNHSGLVISIDGRKADASTHEYWAFLVNGKMAEVGPQAYQTKDGDRIEWKIAHY